MTEHVTDPVGRAELSAEWALWGKDERDTDYRVLRCSTDGVFRRRDFAREIDRNSPGTLDIRDLPQVTVSWLRSPGSGMDSPPTHLGLAIHETSARDKSPGGPARIRFDAAGREIVYIRYFCVPCDQLAEHHVGYRQFYDTFRGVTLPRPDSDPVSVPLAAPAEPPPALVDDRFARYVAERLMSAHPVCILGAQETPYEARLRFLDVVMSWLPYGARRQLAAATAVNSNFTRHRYRLFFASVPRSEPMAIEDSPGGGRPSDITVEWDQLDPPKPGDPGLPPGTVNWSVLARLRNEGVLTRSVRHVSLSSEKHIVGGISDAIWEEEDRAAAELAARQAPPEPALPADSGNFRSGFGPPGRDRTVVDDIEDLPQYIERLTRDRMWPRRGQPLGQRRRTAEFHGLLNVSPPLPKWLREYYDQLLDTVVDDPVTYADYLWVIEHTPAPPDDSLLRALEQRLPTSTATLAWLLIQHDLGADLRVEIKRRSGSDKPLDQRLARQLVENAVLAADRTRNGAKGSGQPLRRDHGRTIFEAMIESLLTSGRFDREEIKRLGYLGPAIDYYYADDRQEGIRQAMAVLDAVYANALSRRTIKKIFRAPEYPPATVLLHAVTARASSQQKFVQAEFDKAKERTAAQAGPAPAPESREPAPRPRFMMIIAPLPKDEDPELRERVIMWRLILIFLVVFLVCIAISLHLTHSIKGI